MKKYSADKIRNVALFGHGGTGKTSIAEAMLFNTGVIDRMGKVEDGNTALDFDADEVKGACPFISPWRPVSGRGARSTVSILPDLWISSPR